MTLDLGVDGMTCQHCVRAVMQAVGALPGVKAVAVDLAAGQVHVDGQPDMAAVRQAIAAEGYTVR